MTGRESRNDSLLAASDEFMGIGACLIEKNKLARGTQVKIVGVEEGYGVRSEIVGNREIGSKLQYAVAVGLAAVLDIEGLVGGSLIRLPFVLAVRQKYTTEPQIGAPNVCYVTYRNNKLRG